MSGYNGRRGVNVSQYIANLNNLNTSPSHDDFLEPPSSLDADLALFTSNEFIDWDAGADNFDQDLSLDPIFDQPTNNATASTRTSTNPNEPKMDFPLNSKCLMAFRYINLSRLACHVSHSSSHRIVPKAFHSLAASHKHVAALLAVGQG